MKLESLIVQKLTETFRPLELQVINESHGHSVAPGSETHFKVVVVSQEFDGRSRVQRHRMVYQALSEALASGVHALAIHTYTPAEWHETGAAPTSPPCLGGSKR
ncbi:BolA family transcriptional regulator [Saccharophagus sp. K07]|jgi:stress-induced morphogen|uniref:BolA family protein n=1 Tax=Saccharophagus sp. K07 TaxID=2283636 RepID=UPI0016529C11|nr:BolA family protein [Saccharophagus sp. K07]MBC6906740.1 BolA family transcriptional regulator [Saccharophagus sp. K07]